MHDDTQHGRVERLVNGGQGLIRHQLGTVLVNDVLPQEEILFSVRERSKGVVWGQTLEILQAHPGRIPPPCPLAGVCGGCAWQHIPVDLQRQLKEEIFCADFRHRLHIEAPLKTIHPSSATAYRVRARMKPDEQGRLGFVRRRSHRIVAISDCLLFCPAINRFLADWNQNPPRLRKLFQVDLLYSPSQDSLGVNLDSAPGAPEQAELQNRFPDLLIGWPDRPVIQTITVPGTNIAYHASPAAFFQINRFLWPVMLDSLSRHLPESFSALDLYSGVGFMIPPLLRGQPPPLAAECHPLSTTLSKMTFPELTILHTDTSRLKIPDHITVVVCDPPRSGLNEPTRRLIDESSVHTLLYISCNQATLLRDIAELRRNGWRLEDMEGFDLFPHTPHLELFAKLTR